MANRPWLLGHEMSRGDDENAHRYDAPGARSIAAHPHASSFPWRQASDDGPWRDARSQLELNG